MKKLFYVMLVCALFALTAEAQTMPSPSPTPGATTEAKPKRKSFRANKEQIMQAQKMFYI